MHVKRIKTAADHEAALHEVERLWGAEEGTANGDRLGRRLDVWDVWGTDGVIADLVPRLFRRIRQSKPTVDKCGCLAALAPGVNEEAFDELSQSAEYRKRIAAGDSFGAEIPFRPIEQDSSLGATPIAAKSFSGSSNLSDSPPSSPSWFGKG
jgi:hypothetical protein